MSTGAMNELKGVAPELLESVLCKVLEKSFSIAAEIEAIKRKLAATPKEASLLLGIPVGTLNNWRSQKRGPEYVNEEGTKRVVYPVAGLKRWMERNERKTI